MPAAKRTASEHQGSEPPREIRTEAHITDLGEAPAGEQRREYPRFSVELDVTLVSDHNFYGGLTENLSAGGVFVATHVLKPIGETVTLSIRIPETGEVVEAIGEVRWIREYHESSNVSPGMGIRFTKLDGESRSVVERVVARREPLLFDDD